MRGIFTCYWTLNDHDEIQHVIDNTDIEGIMTDRIDDLQGYFMPHIRKQAAQVRLQQEAKTAASSAKSKKEK